MDQPKPAGRLRDALRSRDLRLLCVALVIDGLGTWASTAVLVIYVFERTGSTTWIALLSAARWLPGLLLASYGGVIADRYERTRVMVTSAWLSFAVMVGLAFLVAADGPLWAILAVTAMGAVVYSPYRSASGALTPEVVPERDLSAANALFSVLESLVVVVGPALGGVIAAAGRPVTAVAVNAASFLVAAVVGSRLRARSRGDATAQGESAFTAFIDGVKALRSNRTSTALVVFCALASSIYGASSVVFVRLSRQLGSGADSYAYLLAGMALGSVLAAGLANRLSTSHQLAPVLLAAITIEALPFAAVSWVRTPVLAFALMVVSGVGVIVVDVLAVTALQRDTPSGVLGRVFGLLDVACLLATLVSSFSFAAALQAYGLHPSLYAIGFGFPVVALLCAQPMRRADRESAELLREIEPRIAVLEELDLFANAARPVLEQLARSVEPVELPAGTDVVREGEYSDALWIIEHGGAQVTVRGTLVEALGPHTYFGEIGLLHAVPRTATVRTLTPCVLWRISSEAFLGALETGTASTSLREVAFTRLARTHPRPVDAVPADTLSATH